MTYDIRKMYITQLYLILILDLILITVYMIIIMLFEWSDIMSEHGQKMSDAQP